MIKIIIIIINPTANDHDSGDDNDEIQVQDQEGTRRGQVLLTPVMRICHLAQ